MKRFAFALLSLVVCSSISMAADIYPNAVHKLIIDSKNTANYNELAGRVGFEIGKRYSYTQYVDLKKQFKVGTAGNYDFLLLSTGGNAWDDDALQKFEKQQCGWETTYYKNHDLTVIHEVCKDPDGARSWVRILKVAKGERPNLHKE